MVAKWRLSPIIQSPIFFFTRHGDQNGRSLERWAGGYVERFYINVSLNTRIHSSHRAMIRTMMQNSHKYRSLKLPCKVSFKCTKLNPFCEYFYIVDNGCYGCCCVEIYLPVCGFLNLNVNQEVITAKSFQNTINNWSGLANLHVSKQNGFLEKNLNVRV